MKETVCLCKWLYPSLGPGSVKEGEVPLFISSTEQVVGECKARGLNGWGLYQK